MENLKISINENCLKNKNLRLEIDRFRKERVIYDKIYRDLEYDYKAAKQEYVQALTDATLACQESETTLEQLKQIKAEAKRLDKTFDAEWNNMLTMFNEKDIDLPEFCKRYESYRENEDRNNIEIERVKNDKQKKLEEEERNLLGNKLADNIFSA